MRAWKPGEIGQRLPPFLTTNNNPTITHSQTIVLCYSTAYRFFQDCTNGTGTKKIVPADQKREAIVRKTPFQAASEVMETCFGPEKSGASSTAGRVCFC